MAKKISILGRVDQKLKGDFLRAKHHLNVLEGKKGRKAISQVRFLEILLAEGLKDGKRSFSGSLEQGKGAHAWLKQ